MGFSDMERIFYATDYSVFLPTRYNVIFPDGADFVRFCRYLTTDLIQPGIINVVRDFNADISLAPASVSLYLAGGMALQWLLGRYPTGLAAGQC
ncbi:sugar transport protein [Salmonella enterica subsp. enterica]|uniref:Sugar transport protein n=1 Tax=Salmonella enterica I TaxID=59201 RepID=A0A379WGI5_SALET|nr:sugar transport protein [Salmonella enterica subsp. enterica]